MTPTQALFHRVLACVLAGALATAACRAPSTPARLPDEPDARATSAPALAVRPLEELADELAESRLHALFPEVEGAISREAIERSLGLRARVPSLDPVREATVAAIELGEYERARDLLGELLAEEEFARAQGLAASGAGRAALAALDRAVGIAPRGATIRRERARVALAVAADGERVLLEQALADARLAAEIAPDASAAGARLDAARAALRLGSPDEALVEARLAAELAAGDEALAATRLRAEAALAAWRAAPSRRELQTEGERALETAIGLAPELPDAWRALADARADGGDAEGARVRARQGLLLDPFDEALHARFARASAALGGELRVISDYAELAPALSDVGLVAWHPALARFELALGERERGRDARAGFDEAERGFARARELDRSREVECRAREALCRTARGWCELAAGDLDRARSSFLASEDALRGGLERTVDGRLAPATEGLAAIAAAWQAKGAENPASLESIGHVERAAKLYDFLHAYRPEEPAWAALAARANREAADALERKARALSGQGRAAEAQGLFARAVDLIEAAARAYADATALAPDDAALHGEAGRVVAVCLQREPDRAERLLARAIELGERDRARLEAALRDPSLAPERRERESDALERASTALGDAYRDRGLVELYLRSDPRAARPWLEKSARTGPDTRPEVDGPGGLLEQCDARIEGRADVRTRARWGAPPDGAAPDRP